MNCCEQHKPYGCNEGRDCPVRQSTVDGGHQVNGSLSFPLHRQVMPPEPEKEQDGYQSGLWMVYTAAALILLAFCFMTWLAYPNLPQ